MAHLSDKWWDYMEKARASQPALLDPLAVALMDDFAPWRELAELRDQYQRTWEAAYPLWRLPRPMYGAESCLLRVLDTYRDLLVEKLDEMGLRPGHRFEQAHLRRGLYPRPRRGLLYRVVVQNGVAVKLKMDSDEPYEEAR